MRTLSAHQDLLKCADEQEVFDFLIGNLTDSINGWDFFVNWTKALANRSQFEIDLHAMNFLVGQPDVIEALKTLLRDKPSVIQVIPALLACREKDFKILAEIREGKLVHESFSFRRKARLSDADITSICRFFDKTGLLALFRDRRLKSVPDYFLGVEVGLDSNGRKNRGGDQMEALVNSLIEPICLRHGFKFRTQISPAAIMSEFGDSITVGKKSKTFDFVIKSPAGLFLGETNYYNGPGSKLNETAGHYADLSLQLRNQGHGFIWITDGLGWLKTRDPLRDAFARADYILNLRMVFAGVLEHIITRPVRAK